MRARSDAGPQRRRNPVTKAGAQVLIAGLVLFSTGRILGLAEIIGLGIALWVLQLTAIVWVRIRPTRVLITRDASPTTVFSGEPVTVTVRALSTGRGRSAALGVRDHISGPGIEPTRATVPIGPLMPGEVSETPYRLATVRRGVIEFGPMSIELKDPCGLAVRRHQVPMTARTLVLPRIDRVRAPGLTTDIDDPIGPARAALSGSEFASLRDYAPGDDLRKVHWPTSARRDTLVVRHDEHPIHHRCTVILDVRDAVHDNETLEDAVSAAASILVAATQAGQQVRLGVSDGFDSTTGSGHTHLHALLEKLAVVTAGSAETLTVSRSSEPVICITTPRGARTLAAVYAHGLFVLFDSGGPAEAVAGERAGRNQIRVPSGQHFAAIWDAELAGAQTRLSGRERLAYR